MREIERWLDAVLNALFRENVGALEMVRKNPGLPSHKNRRRDCVIKFVFVQGYFSGNPLKVLPAIHEVFHVRPLKMGDYQA
jgi:hypothetical protein